MILRSMPASFMPTHRMRMAIRSLGMKLTVISVRAFMPSRRMVFCPVTTSLRSVRFMFFRLSEMV